MVSPNGGGSDGRSKAAGSTGRRSMLRWWAALMALAVATVASWMAAPPALAATVGTCPYQTYHRWGHQYSWAQYYGEDGWLVTYEPSVPHINDEFSLSHLYSYYGSSDPANAYTEVEVGWYKGEGNQDYSSSHYYWTYMDEGSYHEFDSTSAPANGATKYYEVEYQGYNYSLGKYDWATYWNGYTLGGIAHMTAMPYAGALAGGEVVTDSTSYTQMETHGVPEQQVILSSYTWENWTSSISTSACQSAGITFTINTAYTNYTAAGSV